MSTILAIPDLHAPFQHRDTLEFLKAIKAKYKPTDIVLLGDECDFHAYSFKYGADPDGLSPRDELVSALVFLSYLYKLFPIAKVCISNHTARPLIKAFHSGIPKAFLKEYHEFLRAPEGWQWAQYWEVDGIRFEHGEGVSGPQGALNAARKNRQSTVIGHLHSFAGIVYSASSKDLIYGMNCGCLIDVKAYAFKYAAAVRDKPILGLGLILDGVPHFVPMILNDKGRWIKKLV